MTDDSVRYNQERWLQTFFLTPTPLIVIGIFLLYFSDFGNDNNKTDLFIMGIAFLLLSVVSFLCGVRLALVRYHFCCNRQSAYDQA